MEIYYTEKAKSDLVSIWEYIAKDNPTRAESFVKEIVARANELSDFPKLGVLSRYPEHRVREIRILIHDGYLIFYIENSESVKILRVLNGAMNYKNLFNDLT